MILVEVNIRGGEKEVRDILLDATNNFASQLMSKRMIDVLTVNIILIKGLFTKEQIYGDCTWEDQNYRPREFTIRLDSRKNPFIPIKTLAHEMVHVKQFARNELKDTMAGKQKWLGKTYDKVPYWELPWEIEANGRERGLILRFLTETNRLDILKHKANVWEII